jgi:hypothetical protein
MCPACMASAALIITGILSTGGLTALANEGGSFDSQSHKDANAKSNMHGKEQR